MFEKACDEVFETIHHGDPQPSGGLASSKVGCTYVTSYSMKNTKEDEVPAIYVPGRPPFYKRPRKDDFPLKVPHDVGLHFQDEHARRFRDF